MLGLLFIIFIMSIPAVTVPSPFKQKFDSPQDRTGVCGREMKISRSSQVYEAAERQGSRSLPVGPPMFPNLTVTNWVGYQNPHVLSRILCSHVTVNIFLIPSCKYSSIDSILFLYPKAYSPQHYLTPQTFCQTLLLECQP